MTAGRDLARATAGAALAVVCVMLATSAVFAVSVIRMRSPGWRPVVTSLHWGIAPMGVAPDAHGHAVLDLGPQQPTLALVRGRTGAQVLLLGGLEVSPDTLVEGRETYLQYCVQCHGDRGDGHGPSSEGLSPPPRDLTLGRYKFGAVSSGALPSDVDLARVIRGGLAGTAMRGWDVPDDELSQLVQYLKTLSPRWQREHPGITIAPDEGTRRDPWTSARRREAVARGAAVYHGRALCWTCHPAYEPWAEVQTDVRVLSSAEAVLRNDLHGGVLKHEDGYGTDVLSPDFAAVPLRSGASVTDVYRTVSAGLGGTPMPGWRDGLPESDVWALAYYVAGLAAMRDTPAAAALHDRLTADVTPAAGLRPTPAR